MGATDITLFFLNFLNNNKMTMYAIGVLIGSQMSEMTVITSDYKEACQLAKNENKNVYIHKDGFFYLKKIYHR